MTEAVAVRIGRGTDTPFQQRGVVRWHLETGVWRTSQWPVDPWPAGTPVIASQCQTRRFILGEISGEMYEIEGNVLPYEVPVAWESATYLAEMRGGKLVDPVLAWVAAQRKWASLSAADFLLAVEALRPERTG